MYDSAMAAEDAHTLLIQDTTISHEVKNLKNSTVHNYTAAKAYNMIIE